MMRTTLAVALLAWASQGWAADSTTLGRQRADARQQQADLQARIKRVQKDIDRHESSRRQASAALKDSEVAISDISRRLATLAHDAEQAQHELDDLAQRTQKQKGVLEDRRRELEDQLRAQYTSGLSPWTALLSGNDPHSIGRDLGYLGYVSQAQTQVIRGVEQAIAQLAELRQKAKDKQEELDALTRETQARQNELESQKAERQKVLRRIEGQLAEQRTQAQTLTENETRLGKLVTDLEAEIARQAELERQAREKRRQEAEREARRQAEAQAQRQAEQDAQRRRDAERDAQSARQQVERARDQAKRAAEEQRTQPTPPRAPSAPAEQGVMQGLGKNLPRPVNGRVQGRFGAERPEGGIWRGVVLRANEGTQVRSVASGRVAYSAWLSGFGNIIIVDHGQQYLSVYAYNQSLLKQVGDLVGRGDVLATVGSTGGQVEPGLYFEIRHHGKPVNPLLWLTP